ncbi:MAG: SH3 domain-containing protein [Anaerolineae bacterium]|nr:SH3 domain-containing protein [Anaerolineae bacterium]
MLDRGRGVVGRCPPQADRSAATLRWPSPEWRCWLQAEAPLNVRIGPGMEYARAWILGPGEAVQVTGQTATGWLHIEGGWLPPDLPLEVVHQPART